jgi:hypothetical protein
MDKDCMGWGEFEAHMGLDRQPPEHWTPEEQAAWYQGYDKQQQKEAA